MSSACHTDVSDPSLSIAALTVTHKLAIRRLQELVAAQLSPGAVPVSDGIACEYDDLFFLRFILSYDTPEKSLDPVLFCFKFRAEPMTQRLAKLAKEDKLESLVAMIEAPKWQVAGPMDRSDPGSVLTPHSGRGVAIIIRAGLCNSSALFDSLTVEECREMHFAHREGMFQFCDKLTRETGILSKQTMFLDMAGAKLSSMMDSRNSKLQAEVSKVAAKAYPQLLGKFCIVNAPSWMTWILAIFRKIGSKRSIAKIELFKSADDMWASDWAQKRLIRDKMPAFMGGAVPDSELDSSLTGELRVHDPPPELTIAARTSKTLDVQVPFVGPGEVVFTVSIVARGINFSATFLKAEAEAGVAGGSDRVVLLRKKSKIQAADGPVRGTLFVTGPGVAKLCFDNTHSTLRGKSVRYMFDIRPAGVAVDEVAVGGEEGLSQP